jgi:hypothetical protein
MQTETANDTKGKVLSTRLHSYWFNVANATEREAYEKMCAEIKANSVGRGQWMNCISTSKESREWGNGTCTVELETNFLFGNQWNTSADSPAKPNARVFDWYEEYMPQGMNKNIKSGHWLEITPDMAAIRRTTLQCGYCGKHYPDGKPGFCSACLDSPYLKETELYLLRLLPVADSFGGNRAKLTDVEQAELLPLYVTRQTTGSESRALKARQAQFQRIEEKHRKEKAAVEEEYRGMLWLWDHSVSLENVIYYSQTQKFSFGWREPLAESVKSRLLDLLCEFPFEYEFASKR